MGGKSKLARACILPPKKTLTVLISPSILSTTPTLGVLACTWAWLATCWPFYGKKTNPRAGLLLSQAIAASKAIANIPTWMGYFARWRVRCVSISEASEILAGCKRIEKENLRRAHWELQNRFSSMQLDSTLSATARPF